MYLKHTCLHFGLFHQCWGCSRCSMCLSGITCMCCTIAIDSSATRKNAKAHYTQLDFCTRDNTRKHENKSTSDCASTLILIWLYRKVIHNIVIKLSLLPVGVLPHALHLISQIVWQLPGHLVGQSVPVVVTAGVFIPNLLPVTHLYTHCKKEIYEILIILHYILYTSFLYEQIMINLVMHTRS